MDANVKMRAELCADDKKSMAAIEKQLVERSMQCIGIGAVVHLVKPKSIVRDDGKACDG